METIATDAGSKATFRPRLPRGHAIRDCACVGLFVAALVVFVAQVAMP
jgi:hypothetical protein